MICDRCGEELTTGDWPFCRPGRGHEPFIAKNLAIIDDTIPGGQVIENLGPHSITVYSKSERRREIKARGMIEMVQHVGVPGTDKSPMTSRWI